MADALIINANSLHIPLANNSVQCVVTSPPYYALRDYGVSGQLGLEKTPEEYITSMVAVFREVKRVLKSDGTLWLNIGDSYVTSPAGSPSKDYILDQSVGDGAYYRRFKNNRNGTLDEQWDARKHAGWNNTGCKPKDLLGIPWMLAFALRADGWWLRSDIIWHKPNPMPESVTDRPTKAHEYLFLLTKSPRYYYDQEAIREPIKDSSAERLSQDIENQEGSERGNGGTHKMKAVRFGGNKADGYGTRKHSGKEWIPEMGGGRTWIQGSFREPVGRWNRVNYRQQERRLVHTNPANERSALCHIPRKAGGTVHQSRQQARRYCSGSVQRQRNNGARRPSSGSELYRR